MNTKLGFAAAALVCILAAGSFAGCNTFRGAGKDIQRGGAAVENAAENAQSMNMQERAPLHTVLPTS